MRLHDAQAYARASAEHDAAAYATYERTHGRTYGDALNREEILRTATRAGGPKEVIHRSLHGRGQSAARLPAQPEPLAKRRPSGPPKNCTRHRACGSRAHRPVPCGVLLELQMLRVLPVDPSFAAKANCTNAATRRTEVEEIATPRHRQKLAACSPVARWHGKSDGSNPLRPPASDPAAGRCEGDRASLLILPEHLSGHRSIPSVSRVKARNR